MLFTDAERRIVAQVLTEDVGEFISEIMHNPLHALLSSELKPSMRYAGILWSKMDQTERDVVMNLILVHLNMDSEKGRLRAKQLYTTSLEAASSKFESVVAEQRAKEPT